MSYLRERAIAEAAKAPPFSDEMIRRLQLLIHAGRPITNTGSGSRPAKNSPAAGATPNPTRGLSA